MENNVDVAIWAHEHYYERFWPMYNYTVMNGTTKKDQPYNNARAPLHIITGSAVSTSNKITLNIMRKIEMIIKSEHSSAIFPFHL